MARERQLFIHNGHEGGTVTDNQWSKIKDHQWGITGWGELTALEFHLRQGYGYKRTEAHEYPRIRGKLDWRRGTLLLRLYFWFKREW